jgi:hypothetical protein
MKICRFIGALPKAAFAEVCSREHTELAICVNSKNSSKVGEDFLMPPETCCAAGTYLIAMKYQ